MNPELGHYALVLALALGLVQSVVPMVGARNRDAALMRLASSTALMQFVFVAFSFLTLVICYVTSDFSVATVYENSHSMMPLIYKVTSVWGNHEGSMLLWVLILSLFGALVAGFGVNLPTTLKARVLSVQSWIACAFYLFILVTSNPFLRLPQPPFEGRDLNPILQDIGLAIHPPLLYLGYVGFSIAFSFAIAALIEGRIDAAWARWVRPWTLAAWIFLTVGIAMGSYWAYYELGWGGFWFWDPVENASLMPWLAGTALLHSAVVMEKRNALKIWTLLLAILAFSLSLIGTFLVRSGVLTSVHTFANDPTRGVFILAILVLFIGGGLTLFAWRQGLPWMTVADLCATVSPIGLFFGRLANFIRPEMWGRPSDVPWAMVFPGAGDVPRHPSQLYEAGLEGLALGVLLWLAVRAGALMRPGFVAGLFGVGYACARTFCEFFREPDAVQEALSNGLTMGMALSAPMLIAGLVLMALSLRTRRAIA